MIKKIVIILSIVTGSLILSSINVSAVFEEEKLIEDPTGLELNILVEGFVKLKNQEVYQREIKGEIGDQLVFRICVKNIGNAVLSDILIQNSLPKGIGYLRTPPTLNEPDVSENSLIWRYESLNPDEGIEISFSAEIKECGNWTNKMEAQGHYLERIIENDSAVFINVGCPPPEDPNPDITVEKQVKLESETMYHDQIEANIGDKLEFKITVKNTGNVLLKDIRIEDALPTGLTFRQGSATPDDPIVTPSKLIWAITEITVHKNVTIEYLADVTDCGELAGTATTTAYDEQSNQISAEDSATVNVGCPPPEDPNPDITVEKFVKLESDDEYQKEVTADVEDLITFKLSVKNTGNTVLNIRIIDKLPLSLSFENDASPKDPNVEIPLNGNIEYIWDFEDVKPNSTIEITFNTTIKECGDIINTLEALGIYENDTVTLEIRSESKADINVSCEPVKENDENEEDSNENDEKMNSNDNDDSNQDMKNNNQQDITPEYTIPETDNEEKTSKEETDAYEEVDTKDNFGNDEENESNGLSFENDNTDVPDAAHKTKFNVKNKNSKESMKKEFNYLFLIGIIIFIIVLAIYLIRNDKEENSYEEDDLPINKTTMCYPNTPKTIQNIMESNK